MRLAALLVSAALLAVGWAWHLRAIVVSGAVLYLVIDASTLTTAVRASKQYPDRQPGLADAEATPGGSEVACTWLGGLILLAGLAAWGAGVHFDRQELSAAGAIIWLGSVLVYLVWGLIIRAITGLPLRWGYGGWYVPRRRGHRK